MITELNLNISLNVKSIDKKAFLDALKDIENNPQKIIDFINKAKLNNCLVCAFSLNLEKDERYGKGNNPITIHEVINADISG